MPTFTLTEGNDTFPGPGDDNSGDDNINALGGNDSVGAGDGNDAVVSGAGDDIALGELGDDLLNGDAGNDTLFGGDGDDAVFGGADDDTAYGGAGADDLQGGIGNDELRGDGGQDSLFGNDGFDLLYGGRGADFLDSGNGDDSLYGGGGGDFLSLLGGLDRGYGGTGDDTFSLANTATGIANGGADFDTILANISTNLALYTISNVERLLIDNGIPSIVNCYANAAQFQAFDQIRDTWALTDVSWFGVLDGGFVDFGARVTKAMKLRIELNSAAGNTIVAGRNDDVIVGNSGDDELYGGKGVDSINAGAGDDTIDGGEGADTMNGGTGFNIVYFDDAGDTYTSGSGDDEARTDLAVFNTPSFIQTIVFIGSGDWTCTGNNGFGDSGFNTIIAGSGNDTLFGGLNNVFNGDDLLFGGNGDDRIFGGDGNDTLDGGAGADTYDGGRGDDTFIVKHAGDAVVELALGGVDSVLASITHILSAEVERLTLTGGNNRDGTGNASNNTITGNSGDNVLSGEGGNDLLVGGGGLDTLAGGLGDDTYDVIATDSVVEAASAGTDLVRAGVDWTLADNVENLILIGAGDLDGTGNASNNTITGTDGDNVLAGGAGNDVLFGGLGVDTLDGGVNNDIFRFDSTTWSGTTAATRDQIANWNAGDNIWVNAIDANETVVGNQDFVLDTNGDFATGEIEQVVTGGSNLLLRFNTDADAAAEMTVLVIGVTSLGGFDFTL